MTWGMFFESLSIGSWILLYVGMAVGFVLGFVGGAPFRALKEDSDGQLVPRR